MAMARPVRAHGWGRTLRMVHRISPHAIVRIAPGYRLQWEEGQQAFFLIYPNGMLTLSPSGSEVLKRCNGVQTVAQILADIMRQLPGTYSEAEMLRVLEVAYDNGWITATKNPQPETLTDQDCSDR